MGTGSSTGIPTPYCLMKQFKEPPPRPQDDPSVRSPRPRDTEEDVARDSIPPNSSTTSSASTPWHPRHPCKVCYSAVSRPPHESKNYRCNPSLLIEYGRRRRDGETAAAGGGDSVVKKRILIDVCKTFRESVIRYVLFVGSHMPFFVPVSFFFVSSIHAHARPRQCGTWFHVFVMLSVFVPC